MKEKQKNLAWRRVRGGARRPPGDGLRSGDLLGDLPRGDLDRLGYFYLGGDSPPLGLRDLPRPPRGELRLEAERQRISNRYRFNKSSLELIHKMSSFYFVLYTVTILFIELDCVWKITKEFSLKKRTRMRMKNIFDPGGLQEMLYVVVILMISLAIYPLVTWNKNFTGLITVATNQILCLKNAGTNVFHLKWMV